MDLLKVRAILIHIAYTAIRLFGLILKPGEWTDHIKQCTNEEKSNCVDAYNEDLMVQ